MPEEFNEIALEEFLSPLDNFIYELDALTSVFENAREKYIKEIDDATSVYTEARMQAMGNPEKEPDSKVKQAVNTAKDHYDAKIKPAIQKAKITIDDNIAKINDIISKLPSKDKLPKGDVTITLNGAPEGGFKAEYNRIISGATSLEKRLKEAEKTLFGKAALGAGAAIAFGTPIGRWMPGATEVSFSVLEVFDYIYDIHRRLNGSTKTAIVAFIKECEESYTNIPEENLFATNNLLTAVTKFVSYVTKFIRILSTAVSMAVGGGAYKAASKGVEKLGKATGNHAMENEGKQTGAIVDDVMKDHKTAVKSAWRSMKRGFSDIKDATTMGSEKRGDIADAQKEKKRLNKIQANREKHESDPRYRKIEADRQAALQKIQDNKNRKAENESYTRGQEMIDGGRPGLFGMIHRTKSAKNKGTGKASSSKNQKQTQSTSSLLKRNPQPALESVFDPDSVIDSIINEILD